MIRIGRRKIGRTRIGETKIGGTRTKTKIGGKKTKTKIGGRKTKTKIGGRKTIGRTGRIETRIQSKTGAKTRIHSKIGTTRAGIIRSGKARTMNGVKQASGTARAVRAETRGQTKEAGKKTS